MVQSHLVHDVIQDAFQEAKFDFLAANILHAKLLTNQHFQALFAEWSVGEKGRALDTFTDDLPTYELPILSNTTIRQLTELRKSEPEAFLRYRLAILQGFKERQNDPNKLAEIYEDVVYPELIRLELSIKRMRSSAVRKILGNFTVIGSVVAGGLLFGLIPPDVSKVVASLGGLEALRQAGSAAVTWTEDQRKIRDNDYYFLWKLTQEKKDL